tara:strand:- start:902 stop:1831 length:930 start_codon:yes stop_codon:yes gene_type:complete
MGKNDVIIPNEILKNINSNDYIPAALLNQSFVYIVKGVRGSGKTLWTAINLYMKWRSGHKVFHNGALNFGTVIDMNEMLNYIEESELQDCSIFIDEAQVVFDSWSGGSTYLKKLMHYVTQLRHKNISLFLSTQFVSDITSRLRQQIDFVISPSSSMKIYTSGAKKGMIKSHKIVSYYTSTENTPMGMIQNMLPPIMNAEDFYGVYDTKYMVDIGELETFTSEKNRENLESAREYEIGLWLKDSIIPKHGGKRVSPQVLTNTWNEATKDKLETKHMLKILKNSYGLSIKKSGQAARIKIPDKSNDLQIVL